MTFNLEKSYEIVSNYKKPLTRRGKQLQQKLNEQVSEGNELSFEEVKKLSSYLSNDELNVLYHEYLIQFHKYNKAEKDESADDVVFTDEVEEDKFRKKVDELVASSIIIKKKLSEMDFKKYTRAWIGQDKKSLKDWYNYYIRELYKNPGWGVDVNNDISVNYSVYKSPSKRRKLIEEKNFVKEKGKYRTNYFPLKENRKFFAHIVHDPNTYYMDIMFTGSLGYLICINANTRYLYAAPLSETFNYGDAIRQGSVAVKDTASFLRAFRKLLDEGMKPRKLIGDDEGCFKAEASQEEYARIGCVFKSAERLIKGVYPDFMPTEYSKTEPLHTSLGIVDRVIRTLRDMAYNSKIGVIFAPQMKQIVDLYNNAPHATLSKYAGEQVTPKMVQNDPDLEKFIIRRICQENFNVKKQKGYTIEKGEPVKVYNDTDKFQKRRSMIQPWDNYVADYKNGMYVVKNTQNNRIQFLPRARITPYQWKNY